MLNFVVMRVAIVHYWLLGMRGGEKVVEALCRMFPDADLFTLFYDPARVSPLIRSRRRAGIVSESAAAMVSRAAAADADGARELRSARLRPGDQQRVGTRQRSADVVDDAPRLLLSHADAVPVGAVPAYRNEFTRSRLKRAIMTPLASYLRLWDFATAARVDDFVANSCNVRRRIWRRTGASRRWYIRRWRWRASTRKPAEDYFLMVSELVAYKRLDYAVRTFARSGRKLKIAGDGPQRKALRRLAAPNIEFCGRVPDEELRGLYARSRALIMPGEEDFGMTMVESLASGKPVIALGKGGALEVVTEGTGVLYNEDTESGLEGALRRFDGSEDTYRAEALQRSASRFSEAEFVGRMGQILGSGSMPR